MLADHLFLTPREVAVHIAKVAREKRLSLNLSQHSLADRSGVSLGVLKRFEHTGKISLESLLKLALVLGNLLEFMELYKPKPLDQISSLDEILNQKYRKRGRN